MKKRKRLNLLKLGVFLFGVSLLLWNCEKDIEINNLHDVSVNEKKDFTLEKLGYSDLITDGEIQESLSKIRQRFSKNVKQDIKVQGRNTADISENFTIITDNVHKVTTKEAITWAFKIKSPVLESSDFENFLVKKHNEEFSYYLVSYEKDFEKEYENATLYSIPEEYLKLNNLNIARKGDYFQCPDNDSSCGGGGISGCSGIINVIPCNNGDSYIHGPESFTSGGYCTGTTTIIDFSHCQNSPSNPSNTTTPDNGNSNGGGSSGGSTVTSPVTLECDNCSNSLSLISYLNITDQNLINWINDPVNAKEVDAAFRFCKGNNWKTEAKTFAEQAVKAIKDGGEVDFDDQIINNLTGKAKCVYEKLKAMSTDFKSMIQKFDGEFPVSHLKLIMEDLGTTRGVTRAPDGAGTSPDYVITIALNNNSNIHGVGYRPNLMTAKTIAHEIIHAEMYRKLLSVLDNGGNIAGVTKEQFQNVKNNFPGLYDYYTRYNFNTSTPNNAQHQQMATHYRETLARILQAFDTGTIVPDNQQPQQLYMDLAWEGLRYDGTTGNNAIYTWTSLSQEEKDRIEDVIDNYIEANKNENCQ